uniref:Putative isac anti-complement n=1 Tax=Ixodes ricinus TaxID=34613 RepID=A0A0K8RKV9_IXORI
MKTALTCATFWRISISKERQLFRPDEEWSSGQVLQKVGNYYRSLTNVYYKKLIRGIVAGHSTGTQAWAGNPFTTARFKSFAPYRDRTWVAIRHEINKTIPE